MGDERGVGWRRSERRRGKKQICVHKHMNERTSARTDLHIHTHTRALARARAHIHTHTHTHTHLNNTPHNSKLS